MKRENYDVFLHCQTIPEALQTYSHSDRAAIICGEESITYRRLIADARKLALSLRGMGVNRGDRILVNLSWGTSPILAILAILYAGASYIVVNRGWPQERLSYILRDADVKLILDDEKLCELLSLNCEGDLPVLRGEDEFAVYYTSGSTGQPKGCVLHHQTFYHLVRPLRENVHARVTMERCERVFFDGVLFFVGPCADIFVTLVCGKTLILATKEELTNPECAAERMLREGVDAIGVTPSLLSTRLPNETFRQACRSVRRILLGGEAPDSASLKELASMTDGCILNTYGATEVLMVTADFVSAQEEIRIGQAVEGSRLLVLSPEGSPVPPETEGEICIGGVPAQLGYYLGDPVLTAQKYTQYENLGRVYHTGDRGIRHADGTVSVLGRTDNMKKIHGQRVELEEIERCLESIPGIIRAAADVRGEEPNTVLCAWYIARQPLEEEALRERLSQRLPSYMVPQRLQAAEDFPKNRHGKLDRNALPEIAAKTALFVPPENDRELKICAAFSEILDVEPVGRNSSFFHLGGDSLRAVRLISLLRKKTGERYSVLNLFQNPTPAKLAQVRTENIHQGRPSREEKSAGELFSLPAQMKELAAQESVEAIYPADLSTSWLAVLERIMPKNLGGVYTHMRVDLKRTFTRAEIQDRVNQLVARHPALRSYCEADPQGKFWQIFLRRRETPVWYRDLRHLEKETQDRYLSGFFRVMEEEGLPFQAGCFPLSEERCSLLLRVNHSLADGLSLVILLNELAGENVRTQTDAFYEYRERQLRYGTAFPEELREYYSSLSEEAYRSPRVQTWESDAFEAIQGKIVLTKEQTAQLIAQCRQREWTISEYVEYCFGKALLMVLKKPEVWYFHSFSGRDPDFEPAVDIIGNLARNVPICIREDMTEEAFSKGYLLLWSHPYALETEEYRALRPYQLKYGIVARLFPAFCDTIEFLWDYPERAGRINHFRIEDGRLQIALFADRDQMEEAEMAALEEGFIRFLLRET